MLKRMSFVIPCYRSEKTIESVVNEIMELMDAREDITYEIILVNDCSPDNVWDTICKLSQEKEPVSGISLAKNFGQHSALMAGYAACTGDFVISLDDDGQTPIDEWHLLYEKIQEGYDVVYAYYPEIKQNMFRRCATWFTNRMSDLILDPPKGVRGSSFFIARRYVIQEMIQYQNAYPYLWGLVLRTTHNITCLPAHHRKRLQGKSGYTFRSLLSLWVNGFTAFSVKPLEVGIYIGFFLAVAGFIYTIVIILRKFLGFTSLIGWSSIISLILFIGGLILIMLGLIGEYIGRIYISLNNAPQYVIRETTDEREK